MTQAIEIVKFLSRCYKVTGLFHECFFNKIRNFSTIKLGFKKNKNL